MTYLKGSLLLIIGPGIDTSERGRMKCPYLGGHYLIPFRRLLRARDGFMATIVHKLYLTDQSRVGCLAHRHAGHLSQGNVSQLLDLAYWLTGSPRRTPFLYFKMRSLVTCNHPWERPDLKPQTQLSMQMKNQRLALELLISLEHSSKITRKDNLWDLAAKIYDPVCQHGWSFSQR